MPQGPGDREASLVRRGVLRALKGRGEADSHEQAFRAQQPSSDLAPGLRADPVDQATTHGGELSCRSGDVSDLELDAGLRDRDLGGPLCGPEAGIRRLRKRPEAEVLCPFKLVGEHVVAVVTLEAQTQGVRVEGPRGVRVSHDRGDTRYSSPGPRRSRAIPERI